MKKRKITIAASTVFLMVGLAGCGQQNTSGTNSFVTASAKIGDLKVEVSGTGNITPVATQNLTVSSQTTINQVNVTLGQSVTKGQTLITFANPSTTDLSHQQRTLQKQNEQLVQLEKNLTSENNNLTLYSPYSGTVSSVSIDAGDTVQSGTVAFIITDSNGDQQTIKFKASGNVSTINVEKGQSVSNGTKLASLTSDGNIQSQIDSLKLDIADTNDAIAKDQTQGTPIVAQMDGVITSLSAVAGQNAQPSTALGTLSDSKQMELAVNVDELDIPNVKVGESAEISVDAYPNKTFTGKVLSIAPVGVVTNGVATFTADVSLDTTDGILPGMSATANIIVSDNQNALTVPIEAVHQRNGMSFVTVLNSDNTTQTVKVTTGQHTDTQMEILSGIKEGQKVVLPISKSSSSNSNFKTGMFGGFGGSGGMSNRSFGGGGNRSGNGGNAAKSQTSGGNN